jgi:formylglycine-generating enzyme required for sulfatase activity
MNSAALAVLVKGLKDVLDEHGFERARSDAGWLNNILADYSPQTPALNRVVATVAREGFPDLLRTATTVGQSDAVVRQAVSRLVSAHAIEQGAAYDAVTVWAKVLGVVYTGQRPSSLVSVLSASIGEGGNRLERKAQRLLDEAEAAEGRGDWVSAVRRYEEVLMLNPAHVEALQLRVLAERRKEESDASKVLPPSDWLSNAARASKAVPPSNQPKATALPAKAAVVKSSGPKWRTAVMVDCGEDRFGRWAAVMIAGVEMRFRYCVPGRFLMGSPQSEFGRSNDEGPVHEVVFTRGFWMAEVPVTQRLWEAVAGSNPSEFKTADRPVEYVRWSDCDGWLRKANSMTGGLNLRFPTEAEWEYAARAGTAGPRYGDLDAIAWHRGNSAAETHEVKSKKANEWGLHDMLGNVWEWCSDWHGQYPTGRVTGPKGRSSGSYRVIRGGSWDSVAGDVRSAGRFGNHPGYRRSSLGFRPALT